MFFPEFLSQKFGVCVYTWLKQKTYHISIPCIHHWDILEKPTELKFKKLNQINNFSYFFYNFKDFIFVIFNDDLAIYSKNVLKKHKRNIKRLGKFRMEQITINGVNSGLDKIWDNDKYSTEMQASLPPLDI